MSATPASLILQNFRRNRQKKSHGDRQRSLRRANRSILHTPRIPLLVTLPDTRLFRSQAQIVAENCCGKLAGAPPAESNGKFLCRGGRAESTKNERSDMAKFSDHQVIKQILAVRAERNLRPRATRRRLTESKMTVFCSKPFRNGFIIESI